MANIQVFVSAPKAYLLRQQQFLEQVEAALVLHELAPVTLGRSDYDMNAPLTAIRRLMSGCCGLLCIAFRRTLVTQGVDRPSSDIGQPSSSRDGGWLTSPYCQIEPAIAYQIGLPLLLWRESGVVDDGIFDRGAIGLSMPVFDLDKPPVLTDKEWSQPLRNWIDQARNVYFKRGNPPNQW